MDRLFGTPGRAVMTLIVGMFLLFMVGTRITEQINYTNYKVDIEQLRNDSRNLDKNSEDVIGQITVMNQKIANKQYWNTVIIIGLTIPDGWDDIEKIEIPGE